MRIINNKLSLLLLLITVFVACNEINFDIPRGADGKSAYQIWKESVESGVIQWDSSKTELVDFLEYMKGRKGDKGDSAYDTWKNEIASGNVDNPHDPTQKWDKNRNTKVDFWNFLSGKDGKAPYVGNNGNWFIGDKDTNIKARGEDGESAYEVWKKGVEAGTIQGDNTKTTLSDFLLYIKGEKGDNGKDGVSPHIGQDGFWYIGTQKTNVKAQGENGTNGDSAYDIWKADVAAGTIKKKDGTAWDTTKTSKEDFYAYLKGDNGDSAYTIWKKMIDAGGVKDPSDNSKDWDTTKTTEADFFKFITGNKGENGDSAYDVWKKDLAARCGQADAIKDPATGQAWDCNKNSKDDFYKFISGTDGKDGADGKDGKPGEPGTPGAVVEVKSGMVNVIAQYSQQDYGEYVSTIDGSVTYKVYGEDGQLAANATVKGLPGVDASHTFQTDSNGEFKIKKEQLPYTDDLNSRFGRVQEVTINGVAATKYATNTYVPNRVEVRLVLDQEVKRIRDLKEYQEVHLKVQRKTSPSGNWENAPSYLSKLSDLKFKAYTVTDKAIPQNTITAEEIPSYIDQPVVTTVSRDGDKFSTKSFKLVFRRIMKENHNVDFKNFFKRFWKPGEDMHYTVRTEGDYYGEKVKWNGAVQMAVYQVGPIITSLTVKNIQEQGVTHENKKMFVFSKGAQGTLDFTGFDHSMIYDLLHTIETTGGVEYLLPKKLPSKNVGGLVEIDGDPIVTVRFIYGENKNMGEQISTSNYLRAADTNFNLIAPYLNSKVYVSPKDGAYFYNLAQGALIRKVGAADTVKEFLIKKNSNNPITIYKFNDLIVNYAEN